MTPIDKPLDARASGGDAKLAAAADLIASLRDRLDANLCVALWDGSRHPLGAHVTSDLVLHIASPGVISSILRHPTLDRIIQHYAHGQIDFSGGTIIDVGRALDVDGDRRKALRALPKSHIIKALWPFLLAPADKPGTGRAFAGDAEGARRSVGDNRDFIRFHYDVGNDFYALFLDPSLQYSCAYFTDWSNTLEQAQADKIDMVCRKLRLEPGDRLLDIGCGWGGLIRHAAKAYGVTAHGITLSDEQLAGARARIAADGLEDRVTVEICDYNDLEGRDRFNKIASVGMYEHIGLKNRATYFSTVRRLLTPDGLFLNHAISRRAKKGRARFAARPEQRALQKYIFPGGELDDIGSTVCAMERAGFEVHDVEGWREHYARTTEIWCRQLTARRAEAIARVGEPTYRIWVAYLGGCSLAFARGSARIYQTLASYTAKGRSPLPPTRADLYR